MSRAKIIINSELIHSNKWRSVSLEGRDLYLTLLTEVDGGGKICDPEFYTRACGYDSDTLLELYDVGLLLGIDDETFVTDFWEANTKRPQFIKITANSRAWRNGKLGFEGEDFKSRFVLIKPSTVQVPYKDGTSTAQSNATANSSSTPNATPSLNANASTEQVQTLYCTNDESKEIDSRNSIDMHPCTCDWCNGNAHYSDNGVGGFTIHCQNCETHVFGDPAPEILSSDMAF